jgi:hypothetical protein
LLLPGYAQGFSSGVTTSRYSISEQRAILKIVAKTKEENQKDELVEMDSYRIFQEGVPRSTARRLATKLNKSEDLIRRWCREPLSSDGHGTGTLNPIDRLDICFEHFLLNNPAAAEMVINRYRQMLQKHLGICPKADRKELFRNMIREVSEAIQAAGTGAKDDELEKEINEAIAALEAMLPQREVNQ